MPYKRGEFNTTEIIKGGNPITGSSDAIFIRNKYQVLLDNAHVAVMDEVHYLEERSSQALQLLHTAQGLKKSIDAHILELDSLESTLESLLEKDFGQEYKMWKENTQGLNIRTTQGISGNATSIFGVSNSTPSLKYLEKYPEQSSHPSIISVKDSLENKIKEVRKERTDYIKAVSEYNAAISDWLKEIRKAKDKITIYENIFNEGSTKLKNCRYTNSLFYKISSEKIKSFVALDTLSHRILQFTNTLNTIEQQYSEYKNIKLVELEY